MSRRSVWVGLALLLSCCVDPFDVLGVQEVVTEQEEAEDPLADDVLGDKHPEYDATRTVEEEFDGCRVTLNKSASVTRLSISELTGDDAALHGRIFPTRSAALEALGSRQVIPSMEVVNGALKPFNDGLYAAVELGAEDGSDGSRVDKRQLLRDLLAELVARAEGGAAAEQPHATAAAVRIAAAMELGGESPTAPTRVLTEAAEVADAFRTDTVFSKPIGFYTWLPELEGAFRRERLLQGQYIPGSVYQLDHAPSFGSLAATALVLNDNAELAGRYQVLLDLYAGLTNPFYDYSPVDLAPLVADAAALGNVGAIESAFLSEHPLEFTAVTPFCERGLAFLPSSDSPENRLMRKLICNAGVPPEENLIDLLIQSIQRGDLDLSPAEDSGWYDHQLYALETLLVPDLAPESDNLLLTREYKEKLVETFRSVLIQTRETHVRQLAMVNAGTPTSAEVEPVYFDIYPKLLIEPFPTFYLRTARAYRFVEGVLRAAMGDTFLETAARVLEGGSRYHVSLADELRDKALLLYGLHVASADSIGAAHGMTEDEMLGFAPADARTRALEWLQGWRDDLDANRDPRVSLPVAMDTDPLTGEDFVTYWGVIGVKVLRVHASFPPTHRPEIVNVESYECRHRDWIDSEPYVLVEQTMEARRPMGRPPLSRDEFRALCTEYDSADAIQAAFEAG